MAVKTYTTMAIARGNKTTPGDVTSLSSSGITAFLSGFPLGNLEYGDDPWTVMKTASVTGGEITIAFTFAATQSHRVLGILNHNLGEAQYTSVAVDYWTGSVWTQTASMTHSLDGPDTPLWVSWDNAVTSTQWRFRIGTSTTGGNFFLGGIFWGIVETLTRSPAIMNQRLTETMIVETAAGGSKHVAFGANVRHAVYEISFSRLPGADAEVLRKFKKQELLGLLTPEHSDATATIQGQEVFWGYVLDRNVTPRAPGRSTDNTWHYDITLEMEGAV